MGFILLIVRFILLLAVISIWICLIMLSEGIYTSVMRRLLNKNYENSYHVFIRLFSENYNLSEQSYRKTVIFSLAAAFALFCAVFACVPFGTGVPIIENGGDLMQMLFAIMLSVGFVFISLSALNVSDKKLVLKKLSISVARLYIPFAACVISIASYLETIGVSGDTFSLTLLTETTPYYAMTKLGIAGVALFGFIICSQLYSEDKEAGEDCMLISVSDMPEFSGKTRFVLQLWSLCIPYFIILLTEEIFFPWKFFVQTEKGPLFALLMSLAGFALFWIAAVLIRIFVVGLCWGIIHFVKSHLPDKVYYFILPLLTLAAMGLVFFDSIKVAAEMIAY